METNNAKTKLSKNTTRLLGINALRKIRTLVDGFEDQDQKNKRRAIALIITLIILFTLSIYLIIFSESEKSILLTKPGIQSSSPVDTYIPPD